MDFQWFSNHKDAILAISAIIAAIVTIYNTFYIPRRNRTYIGRAEVNVTGTIANKGAVTYLLVTSEFKNIGVSEVPIDANSNICLHMLKPIDESVAIQAIEWKLGEEYKLPSHHTSADGNEAVTWKQLFTVPAGVYCAFCVRLTVISKETDFIAETILFPPEMTEKASLA